MKFTIANQWRLTELFWFLGSEVHKIQTLPTYKITSRRHFGRLIGSLCIYFLAPGVFWGPWGSSGVPPGSPEEPPGGPWRPRGAPGAPQSPKP